MVISQGDVFWVDLGKPSGSGPGYRHPYVVIQNNVFNQSRIGTVVVCSLTSNLELDASPGNVTLKRGEAGLPKRSVVNISQIFTANKADLVKLIGKLSQQRILEVLSAVHILIEPLEPGGTADVP